MKDQSVTVVVSVKNAKDTIEECVNSILQTHYLNKKIFIIDNGSTDGTYETLKKFGRKIQLGRVLGPVPKVHNYALSRINTKFVAYTDADCVVDKNWLKNLIGGFASNEIVATAGYCGTPEKVNRLQQVIGRELESRWEKFPKVIARAPTMNLCVRTEAAKKTKFDEKFSWAWETDFGYRLNLIGKMVYIPTARVYHYHRATWSGFFKQQLNNAMITPLLYLHRHRNRMFGDQISTTSMLATLVFSYLSLGFFLIGWNSFALLLFFIVLSVFIMNSIKLSRNVSDFFYFLAIFFVRTVVWMVGILLGLIDLIKR